MSSAVDFRAALSNVPADIANALEQEFVELEARFARGDWGPAELNGGRLAEALLRYLEWKQSGGPFTPIGTQLNRTTIVHKVENDATLPEGIRFHVRRCAELLMDIRNKRDVAHLGAVVDVDEMDAQLVLRLANWSLAEIVRQEGQLDAAEAQALIDRLSATHVPLIEEIDGDLVIVADNLLPATKALVILYHSYPDPVSLGDLQQAVRYTSHASNFRRLLTNRQEKGLVHLKDDKAYLTRKGAAWVEASVDFDVQL